MRSTISIGGKVKKTPSSQVDPDRYSFLKLSDAEPDLGVPTENQSLVLSTTTGNRSWAGLGSGLKVISNRVVVDESTVEVDTAGFSNSASDTLKGVLGDLDSAIDNLSVSVETDATIDGSGIENDPLGVADNSVNEDKLKINGESGILGQVLLSDGAGEMTWGPHHSSGASIISELGEHVFDTVSPSLYRAGKYKIAISSLQGAYQWIELNFIHDDTDVYLSQESNIFTVNHGTFGARLNQGNIEFFIDPIYAQNEINFTRELIRNTTFAASFPTDLQVQSFGVIDLQVQNLETIDLQI